MKANTIKLKKLEKSLNEKVKQDTNKVCCCIFEDDSSDLKTGLYSVKLEIDTVICNIIKKLIKTMEEK